MKIENHTVVTRGGFFVGNAIPRKIPIREINPTIFLSEAIGFEGEIRFRKLNQLFIKIKKFGIFSDFAQKEIPIPRISDFLKICFRYFLGEKKIQIAEFGIPKNSHLKNSLLKIYAEEENV